MHLCLSIWGLNHQLRHKPLKYNTSDKQTEPGQVLNLTTKKRERIANKARIEELRRSHAHDTADLWPLKNLSLSQTLSELELECINIFLLNVNPISSKPGVQEDVIECLWLRQHNLAQSVYIICFVLRSQTLIGGSGDHRKWNLVNWRNTFSNAVESMKFRFGTGSFTSVWTSVSLRWANPNLINYLIDITWYLYTSDVKKTRQKEPLRPENAKRQF